MHNDLGNHASEEELDQAESEAEAGPVVAVLQNLKAVTVEVNLAVKVHLMEGLHGDLVLASILGLILGLLEGEVVLDRAAGKLGLLILAGGKGRGGQPETRDDGQGGDEGEEDGCLQAATNLP